MKADDPSLMQFNGLHERGMFHAEWRRVAPAVQRRRCVKRGESLYAMGDAPTALYEVIAGCFKTCLTHGNGREQITGFQVLGDFMGLDGIGLDRHVTTAVALEDSQVNMVPLEVIRQLSGESPGFQHHFHQMMSREADRGRQMMVLLGSMQAKERVANFLLDLLERLNARGYSASAVHLRMTRDEIGSYLGLTLETVSRMLTNLKQRGALEVTNRDIRIVDAEAVRRAAAGLD